MCGIVGIVQKDNCFTDLYDSLIMLQHRGQDAAGMTICENGKLSSRKQKVWSKKFLINSILKD